MKMTITLLAAATLGLSVQAALAQTLNEYPMPASGEPGTVLKSAQKFVVN
jgi:hypothetical protein